MEDHPVTVFTGSDSTMAAVALIGNHLRGTSVWRAFVTPKERGQRAGWLTFPRRHLSEKHRCIL
jgi:hypothetical protein